MGRRDHSPANLLAGLCNEIMNIGAMSPAPQMMCYSQLFRGNGCRKRMSE